MSPHPRPPNQSLLGVLPIPFSQRCLEIQGFALLQVSSAATLLDSPSKARYTAACLHQEAQLVRPRAKPRSSNRRVDVVFQRTRFHENARNGIASTQKLLRPIEEGPQAPKPTPPKPASTACMNEEQGQPTSSGFGRGHGAAPEEAGAEGMASYWQQHQQGDLGNTTSSNVQRRSGEDHTLPSLASLPLPQRPSGMSISSLLGGNDANDPSPPGHFGSRVSLPPMSFDAGLDRRRQNPEPTPIRAEDALPRPKPRSESNSPTHPSTQDSAEKREKRRHHHHHVPIHSHAHHHHHHHHHRFQSPREDGGSDNRDDEKRGVEELPALPIRKPQRIIHNEAVLELLEGKESTNLGSVVYENQNVALPRLEGRENAVIRIRIPRRYLANSDYVAKRSIWGTDVYTDDSDPVCILLHTGNWDSSFSHDAIISFRVLPPLVSYSGCLRNNVKSRSWTGRHDGMSIIVDEVQWIKTGLAEDRGFHMIKKRLQEYNRLSGKGVHMAWKPEKIAAKREKAGEKAERGDQAKEVSEEKQPHDSRASMSTVDMEEDAEWVKVEGNDMPSENVNMAGTSS